MAIQDQIYQATTNDIRISVTSRYEAKDSKPDIGQFIYSYTITIENLGSRTVRLLSRHWRILDSTQEFREIRGEGVIGKQPTLKPNEGFQYMSWSPLNSAMGKMMGTFLFEDIDDNITFEVEIPAFRLTADFVLN